MRRQAWVWPCGATRAGGGLGVKRQDHGAGVQRMMRHDAWCWTRGTNESLENLCFLNLLGRLSYGAGHTLP